VRASIGIYNDKSDIDALCDCLAMIAAGKQRGQYVLCRETGTYEPVDKASFKFETYFGLEATLPCTQPRRG
jgi:hypothetical protein